jgi:hypothetical protein
MDHMSHNDDETDATDDGTQKLHETADSVVDSLKTIDTKVSAMSAARTRDPDTLSDKIVKAAVPSLAGLVAGKAFQMLWDKETVKRRGSVDANDDDSQQQGFLMSLLFAAMSAAFTAVISQISDRGSKAFVARRQVKRHSK